MVRLTITAEIFVILSLLSDAALAQPDLPLVAKRIVEQTNEFRREHKLAAVKVDPELEKAAAAFAAFMAKTDKYSHTADGRQPAERAADQGYEYCLIAENIAFQFSTAGFTTAELAEGFVTGWIESPPHKKNMLDADVTETGVAVAQSEQSGKYYAVQMFGRPKSQQIEFSIANQTAVEVRYEIEDEEFALPPRFTRTHQRCRPAALELTTKPAAEERGKPQVESVHPEDGDRFIVVAGEDGVPALRRAPME
jgi:uncharacterized protein YkwD